MSGWEGLLEEEEEQIKEVEKKGEKESEEKEREICPYCGEEFKSVSRHKPYCNENPKVKEKKEKEKEREKQIKEFKNEIKKLKEKNKELKTKISKEKRQIENEKVNELETKFKNLKDQNEELRVMVSELNREIEKDTKKDVSPSEIKKKIEKLKRTLLNLNNSKTLDTLSQECKKRKKDAIRFRNIISISKRKLIGLIKDAHITLKNGTVYEGIKNNKDINDDYVKEYKLVYDENGEKKMDDVNNAHIEACIRRVWSGRLSWIDGYVNLINDYPQLTLSDNYLNWYNNQFKIDYDTIQVMKNWLLIEINKIL